MSLNYLFVKDFCKEHRLDPVKIYEVLKILKIEFEKYSRKEVVDG